MKHTISNDSIPKVVLAIAETIQKAGFEAYLIGGCVRDLLLGKKPKDWDITTNATPEQIQALFTNTFYENSYGTVGVVTEQEDLDPTLKIVEVTPYRLEAGYSDNRRPDHVIFSQNLEDDLKRRDFTINAIAHNPFLPFDKRHIVDLYKGQDDIKDKILRTVGNPVERFQEDALRILRAIRLSCELDFEIEHETEKALKDNVHLLANISKERIREEFTKLLMSHNPERGLELCRKFHVLPYISPDLEAAIGVEQGGVHKYDVWQHLLKAVQHAADKGWGLDLRLAALFHDIGKPATRRAPEASSQHAGTDKWTFYGHEVVGTKMAKKVLHDLKFPMKLTEKVLKLIRWHMFFSDTETISHSAVRRLVVNVGKDNVWDLMNLRIADRIGTGRPKESPYRLRKYHAMIEEVLRDPISVSMLKIDGKRILGVTGTSPGPHIGNILHALLEEVIEDPKKNTPDYLESRTLELIKLPDQALKKLGEQGREVKQEVEDEKVKEIRNKHHVE
jgi:tRNA nucleotidyltransferase (CCA-adding enzyme)